MQYALPYPIALRTGAGAYDAIDATPGLGCRRSIGQNPMRRRRDDDIGMRSNDAKEKERTNGGKVEKVSGAREGRHNPSNQVRNVHFTWPGCTYLFDTYKIP